MWVPYTTYRYGNLDDGQEAPSEMAYLLEIATVLQSHLTAGADAALYWDAVDYLWLLHDAISQWGLLRGPQAQPPLSPRKRYYGLLQILPYLQPGARVLEDSNAGDDQLHSLAVRTADGVPAVFLVNQDFVPVDLRLTLSGGDADSYPEMSVTRTERGRLAERVGRLSLHDGEGRLTLPPRSITTLFPVGAGPQLDDD